MNDLNKEFCELASIERRRLLGCEAQARYRKSHPERIKAYRDANRDKHVEYVNRWGKLNKIKRGANLAVMHSIQRGTLVRKPCEVCDSIPAHAHHTDYSKPLDVKWLCPDHHRDVHAIPCKLLALAVGFLKQQKEETAT